MERSRLGVLEPFGRNLIQNPCATERLRHWETQESWVSWTVRENRDFVEGAEAQTCFVTWHQWGAREDYSCRYTISGSLLAASRNLVLAEFSSQPDRIPQWNSAEYQQVSHVFQNCGPGVRHIRFLHKGQDEQYWSRDHHFPAILRQQYEARVTNSTVLVKIS
ncbi:hypothetical protein lerEdw1_009749 [Lerista edwardsae]|nr:hypothetical protein lerEdw1_009749 [Lerista edwardsae]